MGKKRKAVHIDPNLPPGEKIQKYISASQQKAEKKDWNQAENLSRQAITIARDNLDGENILQGRANLQLGLVMINRGHYAQARKPIEIAQKIAESQNDHRFKAQVYGCLADLCFLQKRKNTDFHKDGKKWRYMQEQEEQKAILKEQQEQAAASTAPGDYGGGPVYEPIPPYGAGPMDGKGFAPQPVVSPNIPGSQMNFGPMPPYGGPPSYPAPNMPNVAIGQTPFSMAPPIASGAPPPSPSGPGSHSISSAMPQITPRAPAGESEIIWKEEDVSMEEKRASLSKYSQAS